MKKLTGIFALFMSVCIMLTACSVHMEKTETADTAPVTVQDRAADASVYEETSYLKESLTGTSVSDTERSDSSTYTVPKETAAATKKRVNTTAGKPVKTSTTDVKAASTKSKTTERKTTLASEAKNTAAMQQETAEQTGSTQTEKTTVTETTAKMTVTTSSDTEVTCTVKIECIVILDNMDKLKKGHEAYVPSDGIILDTYSVTLPPKATAYSALKKACDDNDIKLSAEQSLYGTYISGINNLDEKDCGKSSGWLYSVNGTKPNVSCGYYRLKNGDTVVFSYTC